MAKFYKTFTVDITDGNEVMDNILNFCKTHNLKTTVTYPGSDSVSEEVYIKVYKTDSENNEVEFSSDDISNLDNMDTYLENDCDVESTEENIKKITEKVQTIKSMGTYIEKGSTFGAIIIIVIVLLLLFLSLFNDVSETALKTDGLIETIRKYTITFFDLNFTANEVFLYVSVVVLLLGAIAVFSNTELDKEDLVELEKELNDETNALKVSKLFD